MRARFATSVCALSFAVALGSPPVAAQARVPYEVRVIEDDFTRALAEAQVRGQLVFVDAWAPWCHTCVFFREHVLPNVQGARVAGAVTFASVDTERDENRAFVARYPMSAWPTFFLVDPRSGAVRWVGTRLLGAVELEELLVREGARYRDELAGKRKAARSALERADDLRAQGDAPGAVRAYEGVLSAAKRKGDAAIGDAVDAGRALEALVAIHVGRHDEAACRDALSRYAATVPPAPRVPALALGLPCVAGGVDVQARGDLFGLAEESLIAPDVLADDRSTLFESLHGTLAAIGAGDRARTLAERWLAFLEVAASQARTPGARAAFDPHRVLAATALGAPERALEAVEASAKEFPDDYNPRARRAALLRTLGRDAEALTAIDEALERVRGPRRARVLETKAEILIAASRHADAAEALHEALVIADALVDEGRRDATMKRIGARLAEARARALVAAPDDLPPIVQVGDPVLRLRALDVPAALLGSDVLDRFVAIMAAVMRKAPGVGLAAPQIGVPWRLFVFEDTEERMAKLSPPERAERERAPLPFTVVANPSVTAVGAERAIFPEGCLSVAGYAGLVERARAVRLEGVDGQGKALTLELRGWPARIVQHETDHVNGMVYVDRMDTRSFASGENAKRFPLRARPATPAPSRLVPAGSSPVPSTP